jgi:hypothetical protein
MQCRGARAKRSQNFWLEQELEPEYKVSAPGQTILVY